VNTLSTLQAAQRSNGDSAAAEQRALQAEAQLAQATKERDAAVGREAIAAQAAATVREASRYELAEARRQADVSDIESQYTWSLEDDQSMAQF
jgi:hypothetical protein